jgi:hypothetical protein
MMKRWVAIAIASMVSVSAMAQLAGLPYADGAASADAGLFRVSGSAVFGDDFNLYGGRLNYAVADGIEIFADLGMLDPDFSGADSELAYQAGAKVALPLDTPVDLALRGAIGFTSFDEKYHDVKVESDLLTVNAGVLVSKAVEKVTVYGFAGLNWAQSKFKATGFGSETDDEFDIALAIGGILPIGDQFSVFAEFAYIDDPFIGIGGRFEF